MNVKNEFYWIDVLRVIATIAVIAIHVTAPAVATEYHHDNYNWWIANIFDSVSRFCVPIFVMMTGSLLLPQKIILKDFLQKKLKRILIPFIFYLVIYLIWNFLLIYKNEGFKETTNIIQWGLIQLLQGPALHLWYVYMIIGLYLFIPILKPWAQNASLKELFYFISLWLISILLFNTSLSKYSTFELLYFSKYIGYLIIGYVISHRIIVTNRMLIIAIAILMISIATTVLGTQFLTSISGKFNNYFYDYLSINVLLSSISIYIIAKYYSLNLLKITSQYIIDYFKQSSYGIYLIHFLILSILNKLNINYKLFDPLVGIPITIIVCLILSAVLTNLIHKLPYGKYISGK